jgi:hypothetical protein
MPITKGKYRRATVDFTEDENEELELYIRQLGCHKSKFIRAATQFAIRAGLTSVSPPPPVRQVVRDIYPAMERVPAKTPPKRSSAI